MRAQDIYLTCSGYLPTAHVVWGLLDKQMDFVTPRITCTLVNRLKNVCVCVCVCKIPRPQTVSTHMHHAFAHNDLQTDGATHGHVICAIKALGARCTRDLAVPTYRTI